MRCQAKHREDGWGFNCQKESTHYTKNNNRGKRYYCEFHANRNYNRLLRKDRGRFNFNSNPKIGPL